MIRWLAILALILCIPACGGDARKEELRIGTASQGGVFYPMGQAISTLVNRHIDGVAMVPIVTEGSVQNPRLIMIGENDIAITANNVASSANLGTGIFAGNAPDQLRALGPLHASVLHMIALDGSPIESIADLKGKRVAVGPAGGGTIPILRQVLSVEGLTLEDVIPSFLSYNDGFSQLTDGNVDAVIALSGFPAAAILQAQVSKKLKFIQLSDVQLGKVVDSFPSFELVTIPKDVYKTDEDGIVVADLNILIVNADMDEDRAYQLTRAIYGHMDEFRTEIAIASKIDLARANAVAVPLHPGAARFFAETAQAQ